MITTCILGLWAFLFRLTGGYDSTVPAYIICTILLEQLIKRYKLFDLIELAKDEAIERMKDGLMVLDFDDQITYANNRAQQLLDFVKETHHDHFD